MRKKNNLSTKQLASPSFTVLPSKIKYSPRREFKLSPRGPSLKSEMNSPAISTRIPVSPEALKRAFSGPLQVSPEKESFKSKGTAVKNLYLRKELSSGALSTELEPTRLSKHKFGVVKSYAVNTHCGLVRNYNEDRVSIVLNIKPPHCRKGESWPPCSYFGVFDGHGGKNCSGFLRDALHQFLVKDPDFPTDPRKALISSFAAADAAFLQKSAEGTDRSGSCALVVVFVDDQCFIANTGDSRAVLSAERGKKVLILSKDHKPDEAEERARIEAAGGTVYYSGVKPAQDSLKKGYGCYRVAPGRLAVSRTFGDIKAKDPEFGGLPSVVVPTPEVKSLKITDCHDFIVMASDGIYDRITNSEIVEGLWKQVKNSPTTLGKTSVGAVEYVMNEAFRRLSSDNITVLFLGLSGIKKEIKALNQVPQVTYLSN